MIQKMVAIQNGLHLLFFSELKSPRLSNLFDAPKTIDLFPVVSVAAMRANDFVCSSNKYPIPQ